MRITTVIANTLFQAERQCSGKCSQRDVFSREGMMSLPQVCVGEDCRQVSFCSLANGINKLSTDAVTISLSAVISS